MPVKFHPRRSFALKSMFLLAPLALASVPLFAAGPAAPWEGAAFTGDPAAVARAAARIQGEEGDDVVVLLMEASYSFDEAGRETYSQRLVYRILTAGAHESWSTVEEGWEPWHQARPEIRARVITPDGAEHLLDPATIAENSATRDAADMFEDGRVLRAPLPATRAGRRRRAAGDGARHGAFLRRRRGAAPQPRSRDAPAPRPADAGGAGRDAAALGRPRAPRGLPAGGDGRPDAAD